MEVECAEEEEKVETDVEEVEVEVVVEVEIEVEVTGWKTPILLTTNSASFNCP